MFKQALRSYIVSLHPKNIKKLRESMAYGIVYMFVIICYALAGTLSNGTYADVVCLSAVRLIPLCITAYSSLSSRYLIPKAMFLCPMKEKERKEYINCVLTIKIGVPVILGIFVEMIWSLFYGFNLFRTVIITFAIFTIGVATYIGYEERRTENGRIPAIVKDENGNKVVLWMNSFAIVIAVFSIYLFTSLDMKPIVWNSKVGIGVFIILAFFLIILVVFDVVIIKNQYKYVIQQSSDYELQFRIKGKVESPKKYDLFAK